MMRIVELATEFAPLAKAGGLGEVVTGLSRELHRLGETVEIILPKYDFIDLGKLHYVNMEVPDFKCSEKGNAHANTMWSAKWEGLSLHLLEARHPAGYFHRKQIYGYDDDLSRFIYFSKAALEYLKLQNKPIDVLHLHDWHVALAAVLAKDLFQLPIRSILLTIHNAAYQGICATWDLDAIGLPGREYLINGALRDENPMRKDDLNLLKGGIVYADAVNAVSPSYAKELLTSEIGYGLESVFKKYKTKFTGILNGLDLNLWDPSQDAYLKGRFQSNSSLDAILAAKEIDRKDLCKRFKLKPTNRPWVGAITRLVAQKGPELLEEALEHTLSMGGTFLLLGAAPTAIMQSKFEKLQKKYADNTQLLLHFEYNEPLSHQIYAALDFVVIPSLYEPCGLSQMIAMRYGTVPIARATGGHKDTIFDYGDPSIPTTQHNGLLFPHFTHASLRSALERACQLFHHNQPLLKTLIKNGLRMDWSWNKPVQEYLILLQKLNQKS